MSKAKKSKRSAVVGESTPFFRGWDELLELWVHGAPVQDAEDASVWYMLPNQVNDAVVKVAVRADTVTQFSGWRDKNNTPIYAEDVVDLTNNAGEKIKATCKFGQVEREVVSQDRTTYNLVIISGFYFEVMGRPTFPIKKNYEGVCDLELMEICGNTFHL